MTGFGTKALLWIPHRTVPKLTPRPLRGGEIGRQNLDFNPKFLRRGGLPHPQILHCWKALTELYKACQFGVSGPRNKKMPAAPLKSPLASVYEFIKKRQLQVILGGPSSKVRRDISPPPKRDCAIAIEE